MLAAVHRRPPRPGQPHATQAAAHQPRVVKRAISKYNARGKVDRTTYKTTIDIAILIPDLPSEDEP